MVHQHFKLIDVFTVLDNIILGAEDTKLGFLQKKKARQKVKELSEKYGLAIDMDAKVERCMKRAPEGEHLTRSKPAPDIFLLAAQKLGTEPAKTMVLEDSYNGVRAGAAGGFVTVMVPDLSPATDEMRRIYTCECASLHEVRRKLEGGEL